MPLISWCKFFQALSRRLRGEKGIKHSVLATYTISWHFQYKLRSQLFFISIGHWKIDYILELLRGQNGPGKMVHYRQMMGNNLLLTMAPCTDPLLQCRTSCLSVSSGFLITYWLHPMEEALFQDASDNGWDRSPLKIHSLKTFSDIQSYVSLQGGKHLSLLTKD